MFYCSGLFFVMDRFAQVVSSERLSAFLSSFLFGWADSVEVDDGDDHNMMVMMRNRLQKVITSFC